MQKDTQTAPQSQPGLLKQIAKGGFLVHAVLLYVATMAFLVPVAPVAWVISGMEGVAAAIAGAFLCFSGGLLALVWNLETQSSAAHRRHLRWLAEYSKWSMLDVFVVALLVVSVKLGALAQAHVREGIYFFAASVVLTMLVSYWIGRHAGKA